MDYSQLVQQIQEKKSFLCVGLDSDPQKIPAFLNTCEDPVFEFNKRIIDATIPYAVAYKPNLAFYETTGSKGLISLEKTMKYLRDLDANVFTIADAKRGDIGNSASAYARAFFEHFDFDAVTVSPYMGADSLQPFFEYSDKWTVILALTSNTGSEDFQMLHTANTVQGNGSDDANKRLYEEVVEKVMTWADVRRLMFVVGATQTSMLSHIRQLAGDTFFLVPGVGAQGGSLAEVARQAMTRDCGLLVNASRSIIFGAQDESFATVAASEARKLQKQMEEALRSKQIIE